MPPGTARPDFSHLQSYASSKNLTRYSCPKCGAYVGNTEADEWEFATGMLTTTEGLLDRVQMWIEDTKDGGASVWLKPGQGTNPLRHLRERESPEATDSIIENMRQESKSRHYPTSNQPSSPPSSSPLKASCHCGAISFSLQPPKPPAAVSCSPLSSTAHQNHSPPPPYPAFLDACTTCRLTTGFEITSWIQVPRSHLVVSSPKTTTTPTSPTPPNPPISNPLLNLNLNLNHYSSSPGVHRYSCKRCTATAFYVKANNDNGKGEDSVDVAVGLLRAESGARAEEWLEWKRGPVFAGDAVDGGEFVSALREGMSGLPVVEEGEGEGEG